MTRKPVAKRVLVVDDDADSREVTAAFLRASGFVVDDFETAEAMLPHASLAHAVVTDITLPGISGWELAARLRADPTTRSLVLFAVTGHTDASIEQASLFDRLMVKPFDPDRLVNELTSATDEPEHDRDRDHDLDLDRDRDRDHDRDRDRDPAPTSEEPASPEPHSRRGPPPFGGRSWPATRRGTSYRPDRGRSS